MLRLAITTISHIILSPASPGRFRLVGLILVASTFVNCGTIMQGSSQEIGIQSRPTGATVTIDNRQFGQTPVVAKLSRKDNHVVRVTLAGYEPFDATITRSTSGWVWGNIVFGGLIGLAVDAISGGLYKLKPEQVEARLASKSMGYIGETCDFYIAVVLEKDPNWEKIGTLVPSIK
ncbi:MAG: PEGA domain-containing protein [bacterium]|nr:PEGA domain-containing protein [bacterium]